MICPVCNQVTSRMRVYEGGIKACANCLGISEAAGFKIDGSLTRTSQRVRDQQRTHERDMIPPHVFDHNTKTLKPNPDFIKNYPDKLASNFNQRELEKTGMSRAGDIFKADSQMKAKHAMEQMKGISFKRTKG